MNESKSNPELINVFFPSIINEGQELHEWPYHITLIPWYELEEKNAIKVADETAKLAVPFRVRLADKLMFGANQDIPVFDVVPKILISAMHEIMLEELNKKSARIANEQICGKNYRPHMTIQPNQPELSDNIFLVNNITVIKKLGQGLKQVVHVARIYE